MLEDRWDLQGEQYAAHPELLIRAVLNALAALRGLMFPQVGLFHVGRPMGPEG